MGHNGQGNHWGGNPRPETQIREIVLSSALGFSYHHSRASLGVEGLSMWSKQGQHVPRDGAEAVAVVFAAAALQSVGIARIVP
jgi:hypothetical protein